MDIMLWICMKKVGKPPKVTKFDDFIFMVSQLVFPIEWQLWEYLLFSYTHTQVNSAKQLKQLKTLLRLRRFPLETGSCCDRTIPPCLSATVATVSEFISMLWSADVGSVTCGISEKPLEACTLCTPSRPGQVGCTG